MGAIGGLLGTAGGVNGTGISAPEVANVQQGVTTDQVNQGYQGAQQGVDAQQALLKALQGQNGIRNQSAVFGQGQNLANQMAAANGVGNQAGAISQQQALNQQLAANNGAANMGQVYGQGQNLAGQLAGANAVGNQSQALAGQQALANQYQNIANGVGPNPAQAALNNATGQNIANQAALMAGQRGAGANVGLLARQAAMQGAGIQQQAVGQSAEMQAQQQLAGLQGLSGANQSVANIAGQQLAAQQAQQQALAQQAAQQVGVQQAGIGQQAAQAAQQVGQQQAQQQALAQQAAGQVGQQVAATTGLSQGAQNLYGQVLGGLGAQNTANVSAKNSVNSANAGLAGTTMQGQQGIVGGIAQGAGAMLGFAGGGEVDVPQAPIMSPVVPMSVGQPAGPGSAFGQFLTGWTPPEAADDAEEETGNSYKPTGSSLEKGAASLTSALGKMGMAAMAAKGGLASKGGHVAAKNPSQKAVKAGNSYANDKIPAMLSEGEIVIPRAVLQSGDPVRGAADFVAKVMAKRGRK